MANPVVTPGIAVSFMNTPQAKDDAYGGLSEESSVFYLDVMANDLAGRAKSLYSIDDGSNPYDLLQRDAAGTVSYSAQGARIWITADGRIAYDAASSATAQRLGAGETLVDSFTYAIQMGNGTLSWATVTLTIAGVNDQPVITSALASGAMTELADHAPGENSALHQASGSIGFADGDSTDTHTVSSAAAGDGYRGSFSVALADDSTGDGAGSVAWSFSVADGELDELAAGQQLVQEYDVTVDDGHGGTATQRVTLTLTGTNDAPIIESSVSSGAATEIRDGMPGENATAHTAGGHIAFADADTIDTHAIAVTALGAGYRGSFDAAMAQDPTGNVSGIVQWSYSVDDASLDDLAEGQVLAQAYRVTITDGNGGTVAHDVTLTVTGTNDAPVITSAVQAAQVTEIADNAAGENTALHLHSGAVTFADVDLADTHHATFAAQAAGYRGLFALEPLDQAGDSVGWTFSVADADLDDLQAGQTLVQSYRIAVDDGHGGIAPQTVTITLAGTNDAPVIQTAEFIGRVFEVADGLADENATLHTAQGSIVFADIDRLDTHEVAVAPAAAGYRGVFQASVADAATGDGQGTVSWSFAVDDAAIDDLAAGEQLAQDYVIAVDDGHGGRIEQTVSIVIEGTNDAPLITSAVTEGAAIEIADGAAGENATAHVAGGAIEFTDVDSQDVHGVFVTTNDAGYLGGFGAELGDDSTGDGAGRVDWTFTVPDFQLDMLAEGEQRTQQYTVRIIDGASEDSETVTIILTGTNDAPVVSNIDVTGAVLEPIPAVGMVTDSGTIAFTDVDLTDVHSVSAVTPSAGALGTLTASLTADTTGSGSGGLITWNYSVDAAAISFLNAGQTRVESFSFSVLDGQGGSVQRTVDVTITGTNVPPIATNDVFAGNEDTPFTGNVLANDVDPDGAPLSARLVSGPVHGTLGLNADGSFTYTPAANYNGADSFTYRANDGAFDSNTATVNLTVQAVNDAPVAIDDVNALSATSTSGVTNSTFVNWVDWTSATAGRVNGTINLGNGQTIGVTYTGESAFTQISGGTYYYTGPDTTYQSALVQNRPGTPDIIALSQATQKTLTFSQPVEDLFFAIVSLNGNGYLFDRDFQIVSFGQGYWGTGGATRIPLADGRFEVLASGELHGVLRIEGAIQSLTWTSLTPEFWNGFTVGTYGGSRSATVSGNLLANDSDIDGGPLTVSAVNGQAFAGNSVTLDLISGARVTVNRDGFYLYDEDGAFVPLAQGATQVDSFQYTVSDGRGGTATATARITVTGANEAPVAQAGSLTMDEDASAAASVVASDVDGDALSYALAAGPAHGTLAFSANGSYIYTPDADYSGSDSFSYSVSDSHGGSASASVAITVDPVNDAPVAADDWITTGEDRAVAAPAEGVLLNDTDVDGPALSAELVSGASHGVVQLNADGSFRYTPDADFHGQDSFTYRASDGVAASGVATVHIEVSPVNDAPVANPDLATTGENEPVTLDVLANDSDVDANETKTLTAVSVPAGQGSVSIVGNQLAFDPGTDFDDVAQGATETVTVSYTMRDASGATASSTATLTINGANDAPVITGGNVAGTIVEDAIGPLNFSTSLFSVFAGSPQGVAVADVNGDAQADILTVNFFSGTLSVLTGNGFGFNVWNVFSVGSSSHGPTELVARDFTGDGLVDVVTVNQNASSITSLRGLGNGNFSIVTIQGAGPAPYDIEAGDLNGDGRLDVVTTNLSINSVSVLLGNGAGGFQPFATIPTGGTSPYGLALADMNQDGRLDIVTANRNSGNVSLLLGNGNGGFTPAGVFGTNGGPIDIAIGDVNGDNRPDIVGASFETSMVSVLLANGSGGFTFNGSFTVGAAAPHDIVLADMNADGHLDVVTPDFNSSQVSVLTGSGNGTFGAPFVMPTGAPSPIDVAVADVNGDGRRDIIAADFNGGMVSVFRNNTVSTTSISGQLNAADVDQGAALTWGVIGAASSAYGSLSVNGFGRWTYAINNASSAVQQLAEGQSATDSFTVRVTDQHGAFDDETVTITVRGSNDAPVARTDAASTGENQSLTVDVLANDTDVDAGDTKTLSAVSVPAGKGSVSIAGNQLVFNPGADFDDLAQGATETAVVTYSMRDAAGATSTSTATITLNGANDAPVITGGAVAGSVVEDGSPVTVLTPQVFAVNASAPHGVAVGDVNGDGRLDIVTADQGSSALSVLLGTPGGGFGNALIIPAGSNGPVDLALADVNGDGRLDVVSANYNTSTVSTFLGTGSGGFNAVFSTSVNAPNPFDLALGDVNGDGRLDAVTANVNSQAVSVLLGNAGGGFGPAATFFSGGNSPHGVALADLNLDGRLDIVAANLNSGSVGVLLGNGSGQFALSNIYGVGAGPADAVVGDVNGDGRPDIVTANANSHNISVLLGNAGNTFTLSGAYNVGAGFPFDVVLADVNSDGKLDAVTANNGSGNVSVLLGNGAGAFGLPSVHSVNSAGPFDIAVADLDSDGRLDFVTANVNSSSVTVLRNGSSGGQTALGQLNAIDVDQGATMAWAVVGGGAGVYGSLSVNGSGRWSYTLDNSAPNVQALAAGRTVNDTFTVRVTDQHGAFDEEQVTITVVGADDAATAFPDAASTGENQPVSVDVLANDIGFGKTLLSVSAPAGQGSASVVANRLAFDPGTDFDDLAQGASETVTVSYTMLDSAGTTSSSTATITVNGANDAPVIAGNTTASIAEDALGYSRRVINVGGLSPHGVTLADMNGDGRSDIVTADYNSGTVSTLLSLGGMLFANPRVFPVGGGGPIDVAVGDLNGDGRPDMVAANYTSSSASVLLGSGGGLFASPAVLGTGGSGPAAVAMADLNADGRPDFVVANYFSSNVAVMLNNGFGSFPAPQVIAVGPTPSDVGLADIDGDGAIDLVAAEYLGNSATVLFNNGAGSFGAPRHFATGPASPYRLALADLDGDGDVDLVTANPDSSTLSVLRNVGGGAFAAPQVLTLATGASPHDVAVADMNGDGFLDLVTANYGQNTTSVFLGMGAGSFAAPQGFGVGAIQPIDVAVGDLNGDGRPDIVTADFGQDAVSVLFNASASIVGQLTAADVDQGASLTWLLLGSGDGTFGDFALGSDGSWGYTPDNASNAVQSLGAGAVGVDTFTVRVTDEHGAFDEEQVTVTVTGVNDAPVAGDDFFVGLGEEVIDFDHFDIGFDYEFQGFGRTSGGVNGSQAAYSYVDAQYFPDGADALFLRADGRDFALLSLDIGSFLDPHPATLVAFNDGVQVASLTLDLEPTDPSFGFSGYQHITFDSSWSSIDEVRFYAPSETFDHTMIDNVQVRAGGGSEDTAVDVVVLGNDSDVDAGDTLTITSVSASSHGAAVSINADGSLHYDPTGSAELQSLRPGQFVMEVLTYTVADNHGATSSATVMIQVKGLNDAPIAVDDTGSMDEDNGFIVFAPALLANDIDPDDGDFKELISVQDAVNGTVSFDGVDVRFMPDPDFFGVASFTYTMRDSFNVTSTATVTLDVAPTNEAPVAVADAYVASSNVVLSVNAASGVLANDFDVDGGVLSLGTAPVGLVSALGAQVLLNPDGSFTYVAQLSPVLGALQPGQFALDQFGYQLQDGQGGTAIATVSITVNGAAAPGNVITGTEGDDFPLLGTDASETLLGLGGNDFIAGFDGDDRIVGGPGSDTMNGMLGADTFVLDAGGGDSILQFSVAEGDRLDLSEVLDGAGYGGTDPFGDGYLQFADDGAGSTLVQIDADGGGNSFVTIATLTNALLTQADTANYVV